MNNFFTRNIFAILVTAAALLIYLPFFYFLSQDAAFASIMSEDNEAYLNAFLRILYPERISGQYWNDFLGFGYGPVYYIIPALLGLPFRLVGFESGVILIIYFISFFCAVGMVYILKRFFLESGITKQKLFYKTLAVLLVAFCLFTPIILGNTMEVRAEMPLALASLLSFYFLFKDKNSFQKNYYLSVVFFAVALCVKALSLFVGVMFLLYFIYNHRKMSVRILLNSASLFLLVIIVAYAPLWLSGNMTDYVNNLIYSSSITLTGWPQDNLVLGYDVSVNLFNNVYINFYSLCVLLFAAFVTLVSKIFDKNKDENFIYFACAFAITLIYVVYTIFIVFMPNNYGILIPIFAAAMIILMLQGLPSIRDSRVKSFVLVALCIFTIISTRDFINRRTWNFVNPNFSPFQTKVMNAQNDVKNFLSSRKNYQHPCIDKQVTIPKINGKKIDYSRFGELSLNDDLLKKCDLFIFWNDSRVNEFLTTSKAEENEAVRNSRANYRKILRKFSLVYNENGVRVFQK